MSDEGKLHEDMARATRAKLLLEDELFLEAFRKVRDDLVAKMVATSNKDELLRCKDELTAMERVLKRLHHVFDSGKVAAHELEYRAKVKK